MRQYKVTHITAYQYDDPVTLCHNEAYLIPRNTATQTCQKNDITVFPKPSVFEKQKDFYNNHVVYFSLQFPHTKLDVKAESILDVEEKKTVDLAKSIPWDAIYQSQNGKSSNEWLDAREFVLSSPLIPVDPIYADYAKLSFSPKRPLLEAAMEVTKRIFKEFKYDPEATSVSTPVHEVFANRRGVCQDFAHMAISCLRSLGLPTRYVSGYLETLPPPGKPKLIGADASHAWFSVYDPNVGWCDFDPTNNKMPDAQYITVAWGRDYSDVPPLKGVSLGGSNQSLTVSVDISPVDIVQQQTQSSQTQSSQTQSSQMQAQLQSQQQQVQQ